MKLKTVFFILGMFISTSILASEADMQLAAVNSGLVKVTENADEDSDEEIGSTDITEFDNIIGAYSREDGAMMGAYGDGEYAD